MIINVHDNGIHMTRTRYGMITNANGEAEKVHDDRLPHPPAPISTNSILYPRVLQRLFYKLS